MMRKWLVVALLGMLVMGATSATATPVRVNVPDAEETYRDAMETGHEIWNGTYLVAMGEASGAVRIVANATGIEELESIFATAQAEFVKYNYATLDLLFGELGNPKDAPWIYLCAPVGVGIDNRYPYVGVAIWDRCIPQPLALAPP